MSYRKILLLKSESDFSMSYMGDWEESFFSAKDVEVKIINLPNTSEYELKKEIRCSDMIVGLHSFIRTPSSNERARKIASMFDERKGTFLTLVGDEVNLHNSPMFEKLLTLRMLRPDYIGTQLPIEAGRWLYDGLASNVIPVPHALNKNYWCCEAGTKKDIDISGISVRYPVYLGDNDRNELFEKFSSLQSYDHAKYNFYLSQSTQKRLGRNDWRNLLARSKGTISCEAGTSYLEKDDKTVFEIIDFLFEINRKNDTRIVTDSLLRKLFHQLPSGVRSIIKSILSKNGPLKIVGIDSLVFDGTNYEVIFNKFFLNYKRLPFITKAVSSRHFEAIGTQTCQIMFDGYYNGLLKPNEHYIQLNRNFSNLDEVLEKFYDDEYRQFICETALTHVLENHTMEHRINYILEQCK